MLKAHRWSDNDHYWGPFTYAYEKSRRSNVAVMLDSGCDEYRGCKLRLTAFGHTLICAMPSIAKPWRHWVDTSGYDWGREGGGGYWDVHRREYGFYVFEGHFCIHYGRQTHDSSTTQSWSKFLPWTQWRHVRHSLYDMDGNHFADMPETRRMLDTWEERKALEAACPSATFEFQDFDGQKIAVQARIEEREWRAGEGWFKWLSWFRKAKISRVLDLRFSEEVGERKGSWKGGTIGTSIEMTPGELHTSAFRRYCAENKLTFVEEMGKGDIPHGIYCCRDAANFADFFSRMTDASMGLRFREAWIDRKDEFPGKPVRPQQDEAATMVKRD